MASLSTYKGKSGDTLRAIQFLGSDKRRRSIRFGTLPESDVQTIKKRIDLLELYRKHSKAPDAETAAWLCRLDNSIYDTLAAGGLVEARPDVAAKPKGITLGAFLKAYLSGRWDIVATKTEDLSARTVGIEELTSECLLELFGNDKQLSEITEGDAEDFRTFLLTRGGRPTKKCGTELVIRKRKPLSESTTRKRCAIASKMFGYAVRKKWILSNPFDTDKVPKANVATAQFTFIDSATASAVMRELPNAEWRLLFALCRWGGLRIGEPRLLTWGDVRWDTQEIHVHSPKTKRHRGHESRMVPIFSDSPLAKLISDQFDASPEGSLHVLPMLQGRTDAALRDTLLRAIQAAGAVQWPRLWHNLRATRQNELEEQGHKRKAVCYWLGNSEEVSDKHYVRTTLADLAKVTAPPIAPLARMYGVPR